jgi:hypothetical protein
MDASWLELAAGRVNLNCTVRRTVWESFVMAGALLQAFHGTIHDSEELPSFREGSCGQL